MTAARSKACTGRRPSVDHRVRAVSRRRNKLRFQSFGLKMPGTRHARHQSVSVAIAKSNTRTASDARLFRKSG